MDLNLHLLGNYIKHGTMMSASLAKLIYSVIYTKRNCFIEESETATDSSDCWLNSAGNGRVIFKIQCRRSLNVSQSLSPSLSSFLNFFFFLKSHIHPVKSKCQNIRNFKWIVLLHFYPDLLIDSLILKSDTFAFLQTHCLGFVGTLKPKESVSILKLCLIQNGHKLSFHFIGKKKTGWNLQFT